MSKNELKRLWVSGRPCESGQFGNVIGKRKRLPPERLGTERENVPIGPLHQATVSANPTYDSQERGDVLTEVNRVLVPFVMEVSHVMFEPVVKKRQPKFELEETGDFTDLCSDSDSDLN